MAEGKHSGFGSYPLENVALGLLMGRPRHGYRLYQDFVNTFDLIWKAGQAKFYVALTGLEAKGYLQSSSETQEGRPARKVYQITEVGQEVFLRWLHTPVSSMRAVRVEFIAKLRFFSLLGLPGAERLIEQQIALLQDMLDEWKQAQARRRAKGDVFPGLITDFRRRQAQFIVEWLRAWKEQLQEGTITT